ncbi:MAG TPA: hypothetical protein VFA85_18645 [Terriglobales bacterium]|nr:hypothetical protein [Terriglobales bacterium]
MPIRDKLKAVNRQRSAKAQQTRTEILARLDKPAPQIAAEVGIAVRSVHRHIANARAEMIQANQESVSEWRKAQLDELNKMREILADNKLSAGRRIELTLAILREEIKLCGTAAESRAIVAHVSNNVDPKTLPLYRRFIHETRWVPEAAFERIWALCRELEELPGTKPSAEPPDDSPLWHDEEEEQKLLTDGEDADATD